MKITDLTEYYAIRRLEKSQKGLARYGDDFYRTNLQLDILIKLMKTDPHSQKITEIVDQLPWKAKNYIMKNIIKIMPSGEHNKLYNPAPLKSSA